MKNGDSLPSKSHVCRYIISRHCKNNQILFSAFTPRWAENELHPSVNWLDYFKGLLPSQLNGVKSVIQLNRSKNAFFAILDCDETRKAVLKYGKRIDFIYNPSQKDPTHSLILGIPDEREYENFIIEETIAQSVLYVYPAI